jgi:hypothetical protein
VGRAFSLAFSLQPAFSRRVGVALIRTSRLKGRLQATRPAPHTINAMAKSDLFFKIEIEHDDKESPQKLGDEICRQLLKFYGVRSAELSSFTTTED